MPRSTEDIAETVVLTIKAALAPLSERMAVLEAYREHTIALEKSVTDLRERLVIVETKASATPHEPVTVDMGTTLEPMGQALERLAAVETRLSSLADVRDRLVTVETKAAPTVDLSPVLERLTAAELRLEIKGAEMTPVQAALTKIAEDITAIRERVAVVEVRGQVAGPPGKDGADGLGFDDLSVDFDGDRTLALKFERGTVKKVWPLVLPFQKYQGVYQQGKSYDAGDTVSFGNQMWHCNEATMTPPGDASNFWQLCVRKGRDGRDGRDAASLPVVSVGGSR